MQDKSDKLHSLKINRDQDAANTSGGGGISKTILVSAIVVTAVVSALAVWLFMPGDNDKTEQRDVASTQTTTPITSPAENQPGASQSLEILNASGYITARRMATVSSEITGRIVEVLIEEGTVVEKGQIVARLDDTLAKVDLDLAKARVRSADARITEIDAELAEAKRVLARTIELMKTGHSSQASLTKAQARVDTLMSAAERAEVDRDISKLQVARQTEVVEKHIIRAPFGGVVVGKNAQPGEMISPVSAGGGFTRTGICTLVDMDSLEIEVDVNESYIGRVYAGQKVTATLDSYPGWDIPAAVIAVVPTANRDKATVKVRISLGVKDPRILPQMGVKVAFLKDPE